MIVSSVFYVKIKGEGDKIPLLSSTDKVEEIF